MTPLERFALGCLGSVAVEIVTLYQLYQKDLPQLPLRFRQKGYWLTRVFLILLAGGLTCLYTDIQNPILALNVGASAPLIFQRLAQAPPGE